MLIEPPVWNSLTLTDRRGKHATLEIDTAELQRICGLGKEGIRIQSVAKKGRNKYVFVIYNPTGQLFDSDPALEISNGQENI